MATETEKRALVRAVLDDNFPEDTAAGLRRVYGGHIGFEDTDSSAEMLAKLSRAWKTWKGASPQVITMFQGMHLDALTALVLADE